MQRVDSGGQIAPGWSEWGTPIAGDDQCDGPQDLVVPDQLGGAYVLNAVYLTRIELSRIAPTSDTQWRTVVIDSHVLLDMSLATDPDGSARTAWSSLPNSGDQYTLKVSKFSPSGALQPGWNPGGNELTVTTADVPRVTPDGVGGAFVTWRGADGWPRVNRLDANGSLAPGWPTGGVVIADEPTPLYYPTFPVADANGGVFVVWTAFGSGWDVFAHHLLGSGTKDPEWEPNAVCAPRPDIS